MIQRLHLLRAPLRLKLLPGLSQASSSLSLPSRVCCRSLSTTWEDAERGSENLWIRRKELEQRKHDATLAKASTDRDQMSAGTQELPPNRGYPERIETEVDAVKGILTDHSIHPTSALAKALVAWKAGVKNYPIYPTSKGPVGDEDDALIAECDLDTTCDKRSKVYRAIKKRVVEKATHVDSSIKDP